MNLNIKNAVQNRALWLSLAALPVAMPVSLWAADQQAPAIVNVTKSRNPQVNVKLTDGRVVTLEFYGDNIFRLFCDPAGGELRDPVASPEAQILVNNPQRPVSTFVTNEVGDQSVITTGRIKVEVNSANGAIKVTDLKNGKVVIEQVAPAIVEKNHSEMSLRLADNEYFYGGGMQNGRFSHRGKVIQILNSNNWVDGGVASPAPFYWSTAGYGVMWYTFRPGRYDFGATKPGEVTMLHEEDYLDVFFMVDETPVALLGDFFQLTGYPVLLPKFGFYEGHLNAYNRDYWTETAEGGVPFEDGKRYKESQKDNGGIKESLNGELNNYQFSARAVVDRYINHDMPLGWVLPNDGYGAGYGQTGTLDGNIQNLKSFGDYARQHGVEIGLWTQSDLHPKEGVEALLQRDIVKEVHDAGVRVLKTDVAWVGAGYSFGLNGVADVAEIMPKEGDNARPFIITLDGWAGTQRYAGLWSGDQVGGDWEYIRFHIPTYIGSGLSGQPNVGSDMDGIFGGKNVPVNVRDFQWKTYTPMQLNMDGWGANEKYPQALGEPATSINRTYLKMKSELMPYIYSIAEQSIAGKPMVGAMLLYYPNEYTLGKATQYQYMFGPNLLVAPVYKNTKADAEGNDIRNGIYLPEGVWIDYFSGTAYQGGRIINNFDTPLWKIPVFAKAGAILPLTYPNNNVNEIRKDARVYEVYPYGNSEFTEYDDDGVTTAYLSGKKATTKLTSSVTGNVATFTIAPTVGNFDGFVANKSTEVRFNVTRKPKKVEASVGGKKVKLKQAKTKAEFEQGSNLYFYEAAPELNRFATPGTPFASVKMTKNPQVLVKISATDVTANTVEVKVKGFEYAVADSQLKNHGALQAPVLAMTDASTTAYSVTPQWRPVAGADYYEIDFDGMTYSTITDTQLTFDDLQPETAYSFKVRAVNADGKSTDTALEISTKSDPLQFAIAGIKATTSCANQRGEAIGKLFDYDESTMWHTKWDAPAVPFDIVMNLNGINVLEHMDYVPRDNAGNGTLLQGEVFVSTDRVEWTPAGKFDWAIDNNKKTFNFAGNPSAQYIKIKVDKAVGNYGSGKELYVFKVPGSETILPGDINHDGKIDMDDFTSYMNYTGLRTGDSDFDGYVSGGDVNHNGLIDAYDISVVGTKVRGGVDLYGMGTLAGDLELVPNKKSYAAGDDVVITVNGKGLVAVNALSFALPYDSSVLEYVGADIIGMKDMENLVYDRLHTAGDKVLYPTFVNTGDKDMVEGDGTLFTLKFKAKKAIKKLVLKPHSGMIVDKDLNTKEILK